MLCLILHCSTVHNILPYAMPDTALQYNTQSAKAFCATHLSILLVLFCFILRYSFVFYLMHCIVPAIY